MTHFQVQNFLVHFWQGIPSHITSILSERQVIELIGNCDNILYKVRCKHCLKYRNFTYFSGMKILWKGTVSA